MRVTKNLAALILILAAAGCRQSGVPEQTAAGSTPVEVAEQTTGDSELAGVSDSATMDGAPEDTTEPPAASSTPEDTLEQATAANTPADTPEQATAASKPMNTPEPLSDDDAGQIYAAAIREVYNVDHSFGGEPPDFPFVYIATTTDEGTLLDAPATPPQKLSPELQQIIEAELTDQPFEIIWVASLDEVPVDKSNGQVAEGKGIYITLGNVLPQDDGTVQLPFYMLCGGLCALGKVYVLADADGAWQVTGSVGPVIMS